jgi:hypothetical protein
MTDFNIHDQDFPLYDELYKNHQYQTHFDQLTQLAQLLRRLDHQGLQIVGLLVKKYASHKQELANNEVPFQGQSLNEQEVKFDVRNFDPVLQYILLDFAVRYLAKTQ